MAEDTLMKSGYSHQNQFLGIWLNRNHQFEGQRRLEYSRFWTDGFWYFACDRQEINRHMGIHNPRAYYDRIRSEDRPAGSPLDPLIFYSLYMFGDTYGQKTRF